MGKGRWWGLAGLASIAAIACEGDLLPAQGEIVVVINTDVGIPDSVDTIRLEILGNGAIGYSKDYRVGQGEQAIPATFGILQNEGNPSQPVLIRLIARKAGVPKMVREVLTTIPSNRVATVRMPIRWMCDDTAEDFNPPSAKGKRCPVGQTCVGGDCYGPEIASNDLPDYVAESSGSACFDVVSCMSSGVPLQIDQASCSFSKPADTSKLNIALKVTGDGICDAARSSCFIALDRQTTSGPLDGWRENGGRIELAREVCKRLSASPPRIESVVASTGCAAKPATLATCGPWNFGGLTSGGTGGPDAQASTPLTGEIASHPTKPIGGLGIGVTMRAFDGQRLVYGVGSTGSEEAWVLPLDGSAKPTAPLYIRDSTDLGSGLPVAAPDGAYWIGGDSLPFKLFKAPYQSAGATTTPAPVVLNPKIDLAVAPGMLDVDDATVYAGNDSSAKPLIAIPKSGATATVLGSALSDPGLRPSAVVADRDPKGSVFVWTSGTTPTVERFAKEATNAPPTLVVPLPLDPDQAKIALGDDAMYAALHDFSKSPRTSDVYRVSVPGGALSLVAHCPGFVSSLAVDATDVYVAIKVDSAKVYRIPRAGGPLTVVPFAVPLPTSPSLNILAVAVTGTTLFYGSEVSTRDARVFAQPK